MDTCIKVMIAEDFPLILEDLTEIINEESDMKVVGTAATGKEMVQLAQDTAHDIILMDIEMEHINAGIQAAEVIRASEREEKIIFLTAHETRDMILTAMGTGAVDYIVKGIADEEIIHHIRQAYMGQSLLQGKIQELVLHEYKRLQKSEQSLLFFVNHLSELTKAEKELIRLLLNGKKVKEIAAERSVEIVTIKSQINRLLKKLGANRTKEVIKTIRQMNLTHLFL